MYIFVTLIVSCSASTRLNENKPTCIRYQLLRDRRFRRNSPLQACTGMWIFQIARDDIPGTGTPGMCWLILPYIYAEHKVSGTWYYIGGP